MRVFSLLLGLSVAAPAYAVAQVAPVVGQPSVQMDAKAEKKICRRDEGVGSRLGKKVCLTREQWAGAARQAANNDDREPSLSEDRPR